MFTGIVEAKGKVREAGKARGLRLVLEVPFDVDSIATGASVSVAGACLTVAEKGKGRLAFDLSAETQARTRLGFLKPGEEVNLERALKAGGELGGHIVMGHVDAVAEVLAVEPVSGGKNVTVRLPKKIAHLVAPKGSIALDGVSLTVNSAGEDRFSVMVIPHTLKATTLGALKPGDKVNLEADLFARYSARLIEATRNGP